MKRRWHQILLAALSLLAIAWAGVSLRNSIVRKHREQVYAKTLQGYRAALQSAATRGEVEDYLRSHGTQFGQECCLGNERSAFSDLVVIGSEPAPWYCSENYIYVAFGFTSSEGPHPQFPTASKDDRLKSITLHQQLGGCL